MRVGIIGRGFGVQVVAGVYNDLEQIFWSLRRRRHIGDGALASEVGVVNPVSSEGWL